MTAFVGQVRLEAVPEAPKPVVIHGVAIRSEADAVEAVMELFKFFNPRVKAYRQNSRNLQAWNDLARRGDEKAVKYVAEVQPGMHREGMYLLRCLDQFEAIVVALQTGQMLPPFEATQVLQAVRTVRRELETERPLTIAFTPTINVNPTLNATLHQPDVELVRDRDGSVIGVQTKE